MVGQPFAGWLASVAAIVVDDGHSCDYAQAWLTDAGATVIHTKALERALDVTRQHANAIDLVLIDAEVHGDWEAFADAASGTCGILLVSDDADASMLARVLARRAGYLSRRAARSDFVFRVHGLVGLASPDLNRLAGQGARLWALSPQLMRLLHYNLWGYSDRDIADAMSITLKTAQQYQEELRRRTGVKTKQGYLRRLLTLAGCEPALPMTDETLVRVEYDRERVRSSRPPRCGS